jgi:hypothetical protein
MESRVARFAQLGGLMPNSVREIPRDDWEVFFDDFAGSRRGWLTTVELLAPSGGRIQAEDAPLAGIVLDDSAGSGGEISVLVAQSSGSASENKLPAPAHVRLERSGSASETLSIESHSGATLLIRLRAPNTPEAPAESA